MPLSPDIWLPHLQFSLQTISVLYPQHPNDVTKKKYYETIHNLPLFFPQKPIGSEFTKLLDKYPVTPYLSSRESFMRWIHFIINKINAKMEWEQYDFYDTEISMTSITVSFVKMSKDLRIANIYFMPLGGEFKNKLLDQLNEQKYIFQKYI